MERYEFAVIGSGLIGVSTAYELAKAGHRVILIDGKGLGAGASSANTGLLIPDENKDETLFRMSIDGLEAFKHLSEELERDIGFAEQAAVALFLRPEERTEALEVQKRYRQNGYDYEIHSLEEIQALEPALQCEGIFGGALFTQWIMDPLRTIFAYFAQGRRFGMEWCGSAHVAEFVREGNHIAAVKLEDGREIRADRFLAAAGAWCRPLMQKAEIAIPEYYINGAAMVLERMEHPPVRHTVSTFTSPRIRMERRASALLERMDWERLPRQESNEFSILPDTHGNLLVAQRSFVAPQYAAAVPMNYLREMSQNVKRWYPCLAPCRVIRSWITPVPFVQDEKPFFGFVKPYDNLAISSGYSSVLVMTPVLGRIGARLLMGQSQEYDVSAFDPNRFDREAP